MTYTLKVQINKDELETINLANQKVVLIKVVPDGQHKIAWVTFVPFEQNQVTWDNAYYLYASLTEPGEDKKIIVNSSKAAQARFEYTFTGNLSFSNGQPNSQLGDGQYEVSNQVPSDQQPWITFGMAQTCTVNSKKTEIMPINAEVVPALQFAKFTPRETVLIFLASNIAAGAVHDNVIISSDFRAAESAKIPLRESELEAESVATQLSFSPANQTITVVYSASLGKFIQQ
ncbi:MAG: hypothetical protein JSV88_14030 [Candidatus Aminicenantes bacterium]|nr:MAG: hypothetical protein JSV88_14030 [Candidatus Aminicenantes bacterium]